MSHRLFLCPECESSLQIELSSEQSVTCGACQTAYPRIGGIPVLMKRPRDILASWNTRLNTFVSETDNLARHLAKELVETELMERSRARLSAVVQALPKHRDAVIKLFTSSGFTHAPGSSPSGGQTPKQESLLAYYSLVHRDWGWGEEADEVTPAVDTILKVLPANFTLGRTLILGAGTARLGWELGTRLAKDSVIVALDINPLPFLVTAKLMRGESVELWELPGHPRRSNFAAVQRQLKAKTTPPSGLQLVFANALEPPVVPHSFDTVVTPWFVDQVPEDAATIPPLVRKLLKEHGTWINQGPFVYEPARTRAAYRYCADEFMHLVARAGFKVTQASYESVPYMASPVSGQGRMESVLTLHAKKLAITETSQARTPNWLTEDSGNTKVPRLDGLESFQAPHSAVQSVVNLIDGQRSVADIAQVLIQRGELADDGNAEVAVRACLKVVWKALQSN